MVGTRIPRSRYNPRFRARLFLAGTLGALLLIVGAGSIVWFWYSGSDALGTSAFCISGKCCRACPSGGRNRGSKDDPLVLDPTQFIGPAREAYIVAKQNPGLLAKLHCYCHCDRELGHKSLLDCYRDYHGASCSICTGEAVDAAEMAKQGSPVDQIRDALRARYQHRE